DPHPSSARGHAAAARPRHAVDERGRGADRGAFRRHDGRAAPPARAKGLHADFGDRSGRRSVGAEGAGRERDRTAAGQGREGGDAEEAVNLPNLISLLRLAAVPVVVWLILGDRTGAAIWVFAAAGVSDAIDGYLARTLNQRTRLGAYLDPLADKMLL